MKKLVTLLPAALIPLFVWSCGFHKPAEVAKEVTQEQVDGASEALKERLNEAFPRVIPLTKPEAPNYSAPSPKRRVPVAKPKAPLVKRPAVKTPAPLPPQEEEELPHQQGVICIFPFNLIPSCTPEVPGSREP